MFTEMLVRMMEQHGPASPSYRQSVQEEMNSVRLENVYQASNVCRIQKRHSLKLLSAGREMINAMGKGQTVSCGGLRVGRDPSQPGRLEQGFLEEKAFVMGTGCAECQGRG